jgi:hypothetical protein
VPPRRPIANARPRNDVRTLAQPRRAGRRHSRPARWAREMAHDLRGRDACRNRNVFIAGRGPPRR